MRHLFTAAAQRALRFAADWANRTGCDELEAVPLLVGLLSEPECRAAKILAQRAIDIAAVQHRWPDFPQTSTPPPEGTPQPLFSQEVEVSLDLARDRLAELPRPLEFATEHVLLGLAAADHEVSIWLRQQGLDPNALEAEIRRLYGYALEGAGRQGAGESRSPGTCAGLVPDASPAASFTNGSGSCTAAPLLRIIDAAANRAREGLRVVEDYLRFVLDDRHLTALCKQSRHDLTNALAHVPLEYRLAARETQADVGTGLTTAAEQTRSDIAAVLAANFARLEESLRSLEEYCKVLDADMAAAFKQLRYRTYTLQHAVDATQHGIQRLAPARLYVLLDGRPSTTEFERLARGLVAAGVDVLQLRDKRLDDRALLDRARLLRGLTHGSDTLMIVNDRPDLALLARADGVHIGQEELSVKDARSIVGPEMLVGVSTHSIEQARQAVLDGANYLGVGPTFPSDTKRFEHFPGIALLRQVAAEIRLPAFAIGGVHRENLNEVLAAGFTRIAVSNAVTAAADPVTAAKELLDRL